MKKFVVLCAAFAVLAVGQMADAAFSLRIADGVNPDIVLADGDADGVIATTTGIGVFNIVVTSSFSKPAVGTPSQAELTLDVQWTSRGAGTLTITAIDDGFTVGVGGPSITLESDWTKNGSGTATGTSSLDATSITTGAIVGGPIQITKSAFIAPAPGAPYTLKNVLSITTATAANGDFDVMTTATIPEPTSMLLWGSFVALGIPAAVRRRRQAA